MTLSRSRSARTHAASSVAPILAIACWLAGTGAAAAQENGLRLNDREYFETRGLDVLAFSNQYNGMFFDEKTAGIEIIQHGVRVATGGAIRLQPTPEQWDQIPKLVDRKVDETASTITCVLRYQDFDFDSRLVVTPEGAGFRIAVYLDRPVPEKLEGRAGLNLEFLPSKYFERTYLVDGRPGIFPRYPGGPTEVKPAATKIPQYQGYSTFDDRGLNQYLVPDPLAVGRTLVLAPEDPERRVAIQALSGELQLFDGRNLAQNGWFVVRSLLPAKATGKVAEWLVRPNVIPNWTRTPVIGFSQVGYHPSQKKVAVVELDPNDTPLETASLFEVGRRRPARRTLKLKVDALGLVPEVQVRHGGLQRRRPPRPVLPPVRQPEDGGVSDRPARLRRRLAPDGRRLVPGADGSHARERGVPRLARPAHMDDALQAPPNVQHFDGYHMGRPPRRSTSPWSAFPASPWEAGSTPETSTSRAAPTLGRSSSLVGTWETFQPLRDQTFIDEAHHFVDIHRPDGKPDLLQQIEHGALQMAAQYRALGRAVRGIVDAKLTGTPTSATRRRRPTTCSTTPHSNPTRSTATGAARPTTAGSSPHARHPPTTWASGPWRRPAGRCGASTTRWRTSAWRWPRRRTPRSVRRRSPRLRRRASRPGSGGSPR